MARKRSPALTDAEARVMSVLWDARNATVGDVVSALKTSSYSTVQTILRILETKGYVTHEKKGRAFVFHPAVDERKARQTALKHLVRRLFSGSPSLLVLNVLDDEELDHAERMRLKKLIEQF